MRQIKFRAWDKINRKMYESKSVDMETGGWCVDIDYTNNCERTGDEKLVQMQFTGLKDKNGKEIYEGDILKTPLKPVFGPYDYDKNICAEVFWREPEVDEGIGFGYRDTQHKGRYDDYYSLFDLVQIKGGVEIIGSIHENPELLEKQQ